MTELFRCRVERKLLADATQVSREIGTSPGEIVRMLFVQLVKRRALPFSATANGTDGVIDVARRNQVLRNLDDSEGW